MRNGGVMYNPIHRMLVQNLVQSAIFRHVALIVYAAVDPCRGSMSAVNNYLFAHFGQMTNKTSANQAVSANQ